MGSNGLTYARHDVFASVYREKYPESYDPEVPVDLIYSGRHLVTDRLPGVPVNIGQLVLSPTRTYAPVLVQVLKNLRKHIHGIVHCSGGAQTKVLHFIEGLHVIKDNLFEIPPLFNMIHQITGTDFKEMYKVFNMGHRMEVYLPAASAEEVMAISKSFGIDAQIIGRVERSATKKVTVKTPRGQWSWE